MEERLKNSERVRSCADLGEVENLLEMPGVFSEESESRINQNSRQPTRKKEILERRRKNLQSHSDDSLYELSAYHGPHDETQQPGEASTASG